jgi:hypothetical protein
VKWITLDTLTGPTRVLVPSADEVLAQQRSLPPRDVAAVREGSLNSAAEIGGGPMPTKSDLFPSKYMKVDDLKGQPLRLKILKAPVETLEFQGKKETKVVLSSRARRSASRSISQTGTTPSRRPAKATATSGPVTRLSCTRTRCP